MISTRAVTGKISKSDMRYIPEAANSGDVGEQGDKRRWSAEMPSVVVSSGFDLGGSGKVVKAGGVQVVKMIQVVEVAVRFEAM